MPYWGDKKARAIEDAAGLTGLVTPFLEWAHDLGPTDEAASRLGHNPFGDLLFAAWYRGDREGNLPARLRGWYGYDGKPLALAWDRRRHYTFDEAVRLIDEAMPPPALQGQGDALKLWIATFQVEAAYALLRRRWGTAHDFWLEHVAYSLHTHFPDAPRHHLEREASATRHDDERV